MTIDHVSINVPKSKFEGCVQFYLKALAPLGYTEYKRFPDTVGLWANNDPDFWIVCVDDENHKIDVHFAFTAKDRPTVTAVHESALKAGGSCNGPPGLRPIYHPNFYGAFFFDPVGSRVEVVCHEPEKAE